MKLSSISLYFRDSSALTILYDDRLTFINRSILINKFQPSDQKVYSNLENKIKVVGKKLCFFANYLRDTWLPKLISSVRIFSTKVYNCAVI